MATGRNATLEINSLPAGSVSAWATCTTSPNPGISTSTWSDWASIEEPSILHDFENWWDFHKSRLQDRTPTMYLMRKAMRDMDELKVKTYRLAMEEINNLGIATPVFDDDVFSRIVRVQMDRFHRQLDLVALSTGGFV